MNQCPYCNVDIAQGYVGEVELESHLKEIHEVSFETMHNAEKWWNNKYVPLGRPSWADMNIGQRRKTINAYLMRSPSTEMRGFLKCPKCGITFNDSENTDDDLTIHLMKDHQVPQDLAEEMTTFEVGKNGLQPTNGWASFESKANEDDPDYLNDPDYQGYTQDMFGNQVKSHPSQYTLSGWDYEEKERMNSRGDVDFAFDSHSDLEELSTEKGEWDHLPHARKNIDEESKANEITFDEYKKQQDSLDFWDKDGYMGWSKELLNSTAQEEYGTDFLSLTDSEQKRVNHLIFKGVYTESKASESLTLCPKCGSYAILQSERGSEWNKCDNCGEEFIEGAKPLQGQPTSSTNDYSVPVERDHAFGWDNVFPAHNNESKANEDSLLKIEENPEGVNVEILDQWDNNKEESDEAIDLNDISHLNPDQCIKCGEDAYWHTPEGSVSWNSHQYIPKSALASKAPEGEFGFTDPEWDGFSKDVQNQITDELTIKDLQEDSKMTDEGFVDKIDMLANKMGVNLDRDPEQIEESKATEYSDEDRADDIELNHLKNILDLAKSVLLEHEQDEYEWDNKDMTYEWNVKRTELYDDMIEKNVKYNELYNKTMRREY